MGKINYNDVQYDCRSLTAAESAKFTRTLKKYAAHRFWHPATEFLDKMADRVGWQELTWSQRRAVLSAHLARLDWDEPSKLALDEAMNSAAYIRVLLEVMAPTFPQELITLENYREIAVLLNPFFEFEVS